MHTSYNWYWPSLTRSSFFLVLNKIVIGGWIQLSLLNNSNVKIPNKGTRSSEMCLTYGLICPVAWNVEFTKSINVHCLTFLIYIREPTRFFLYTHIIRVINKAEVNPTDKLIQKGVNCFLIKTEVFLTLHFTCTTPMQFHLKLMHMISQRYLTFFGWCLN